MGNSSVSQSHYRNCVVQPICKKWLKLTCNFRFHISRPNQESDQELILQQVHSVLKYREVNRTFPQGAMTKNRPKLHFSEGCVYMRIKWFCFIWLHVWHFGLFYKHFNTIIVLYKTLVTLQTRLHPIYPPPPVQIKFHVIWLKMDVFWPNEPFYETNLSLKIVFWG